MIVRNQNFHGNPVLARRRPPERVRVRGASGKKYSDALQLFMSLIGASRLADKRRSEAVTNNRRGIAVAIRRHSFLSCKQRLDMASPQGVTDPLRRLSGFSYDFVTAATALFLHSADFLDVCVAAQGLLGRPSG
jgi:hypothetical protein